MGKFNRIETGISDLCIIEPAVFGDDRGFFMESYNKKDFTEIGLPMDFVQDNHSKSKKGVLRGVHFQTKHPQGKLVRVIKGSVWDVAVDLRTGSDSYGKWYAVLLSETNRKLFYIPEGFAHGFLTLEDNTEFIYKCTEYYYPQYDSGIRYDDSIINISWPFKEYGINKEEIILSDKDSKLPTLEDYNKSL